MSNKESPSLKSFVLRHSLLAIGHSARTTTPNEYMDGQELHALVRSHLPLAGHLYAIVDSARDRKLARAAWGDFNLSRWWLFDSTADSSMSAVAPYLVALPCPSEYPFDGSGYFDMLAERVGTSSFILIITTANSRDIWEHLRDLFLLRDEDGRSYFFRFYDPRVLRTFLPTCTPSQVDEFFGPITSVLADSREGVGLAAYGSQVSDVPT